MPAILYCDRFYFAAMLTVDLSCFHENGQNIQGSSLARYLLAEDACYDRGSTTRLRRLLTDAVVDPKISRNSDFM